MPTSGLSAVVGKAKEEFSPNPLNYDDMRPGCYDPVARLEDMDRAGIIASLCFPTLPRFCGQLFYEAKDRDFGFVCLQAYNDWMIDEWCGAAPGRYIPLVLIPIWDPALAAKELERCAAKGATAFCFSENPEPLGLPTIHDPDRYWDPVMAGGAGHADGRVHARRLVVDHAAHLVGRARARQPHLRRDPRRGHDARVAVQRLLRADARAQDRALRGQHRLDALLHRAGRAGHRQAAPLGEEHERRVLREQGRHPAGDGRPRPPRRARSRSATTSTAASSRRARGCGRSTSSARTT